MKFIISLVIVFLITPYKLKAAKPYRVDENKNILSMPLKNRMVLLRNKKSASHFKNFENIIFNNKESLQMRWRALISMGILYGKKAQPVLNRALLSDKWFLRNSAIIASKYSGREYAIKVATNLLTDKALVVRTAAVQNLKILKAHKTRERLWLEINNKGNFRKQQSLWVRRYIAEALVMFAKPEDDFRFYSLLSDVDDQVKKEAVKGLEKLTGFKLAEKKSYKEKIDQWKQWWVNSNPQIL